MKIPKEVKLYCKKCKKHSEHKLKEFKTGAKSALKEHARKHEEKHIKGYGGKARHVVHIKKQSKKPVFVAACIVCNQKQYYVGGNKTKKKAELT
jgi:large subunit ribosomal protein L44e